MRQRSEEPSARCYLGCQLAAARRASGLSQRRLARRIERRHSIVSRWESGEREPTAWDLDRLRRILGLDLDRLLAACALSSSGRRWSSRAHPQRKRAQLGRALAAARLAAKVSLAECVRHGVLGRRLLRIEAGVDPSLQELRLLCDLYGYAVSDILRAAVLDKPFVSTRVPRQAQSSEAERGAEPFRYQRGEVVEEAVSRSAVVRSFVPRSGSGTTPRLSMWVVAIRRHFGRFHTMARRLAFTPDQYRSHIYQRALRYLDESGLDQSLPAFKFGVRFLESHRSVETMRGYASHLARFFTWCHERGLDPYAVGALDARTYEAFVERQQLAPASIKGRLATIRSFYRAAWENDEIARNPFRSIRLSARPLVETPALTAEQLNAVLDTIAAQPRISLHEQRDYALIYLGSRVGPRRKELRALTWADVANTVRGATVRLNRKGAKIDIIALPADALATLDSWKAVLEAALRRKVKPTEPVFPSIGYGGCDIRQARRGTLIPPSLQTITDTVRDRFADAGLVGPRYATHVLRASAATIAFEHGATMDEIQIMLGHQSQATTWMYIRRINRPNPADRWHLRVQPFPLAQEGESISFRSTGKPPAVAA